MNSAKLHITKIVEDYIRLRPADFEIVKEGIKMQRGLHLDEFASAKLNGSAYTRALFEIPEELSQMFIMQLTEEEMEWFKAGGTNRKEGGLWFAKAFPAFALPSSI